jgi:hypothetical protein
MLHQHVVLPHRRGRADRHTHRTGRVHLEEGGAGHPGVEPVGACAEDDPEDEEPGGHGHGHVAEPAPTPELPEHVEGREPGAAADRDHQQQHARRHA